MNSPKRFYDVSKMQKMQKARRDWNEKHSAKSPFPYHKANFGSPVESTDGSPMTPSKHSAVDMKGAK
jgi:hypothetical protein